MRGKGECVGVIREHGQAMHVRCAAYAVHMRCTCGATCSTRAQSMCSSPSRSSPREMRTLRHRPSSGSPWRAASPPRRAQAGQAAAWLALGVDRRAAFPAGGACRGGCAGAAGPCVCLSLAAGVRSSGRSAASKRSRRGSPRTVAPPPYRSWQAAPPQGCAPLQPPQYP